MLRKRGVERAVPPVGLHVTLRIRSGNDRIRELGLRTLRHCQQRRAVRGALGLGDGVDLGVEKVRVDPEAERALGTAAGDTLLVELESLRAHQLQ